MKLKKLAAAALAAVLSLTMLTACGGGGGGTSNPGGSVDPTPGGETKSEFAETRTAKYFAKLGVTPDNVYLEASLSKTGWEGTFVFARKGQNARYDRDFKVPGSTVFSKEHKLAMDEVVYELNEEKKTYMTYAEYYGTTAQQMARESYDVRCADGFFAVPANDENLIWVKTRNCVVNGQTYDAEEFAVYTDKKDGTVHKFIFCYDENGTEPKYVAQETNGGVDTIMTIKNIHANPDSSLLSLAGYTKAAEKSEMY